MRDAGAFRANCDRLKIRAHAAVSCLTRIICVRDKRLRPARTPPSSIDEAIVLLIAEARCCPRSSGLVECGRCRHCALSGQRRPNIYQACYRSFCSGDRPKSGATLQASLSEHRTTSTCPSPAAINSSRLYAPNRSPLHHCRAPLRAIRCDAAPAAAVLATRPNNWSGHCRDFKSVAC